MLRLTSLALASCSFLLVSCGDAPSHSGQQAGLALPSLAQQPGQSSSQDSSPAQVTEAFMRAVDADDTEAWEELLTEAAVAELHGDSGMSMDFNGDRIDAWSVGEEHVEGSEASVEVTVENEGEEQSLAIKLREEAGAWRIFGMGMPMGDSEWLVSFEGSDDDVTALGDALGEALGEALTEGLTEAFEGAMSEWEAGGSAEEIAANRATFEALSSVDEHAHDAAWMVDIDADGRVALDVLAEVLGDPGYPVAETDHFNHASTIALSGVSRLEALEALCVEAGVVPVFPSPQAAWNDEPVVLTFRPGTRTLPTVFSGPFQAEVRDVEEHAPNSTGALTVTVRALGLHPSVFAANQQMATFVTLDGVTSAANENLLAQPDVSWMGSPTVWHGLLEYSLTPELRGLLRSVESLSVEGSVALRLPTEVHAGTFANASDEASVAAGPWTVEWSERGTYNQLAFRHSDGETSEGGVRFAPEFDSGALMGIQSEGSYGAGNYLSANLSTPETPGTLGFKVFTPSEQTYTFILQDLPLEHFADQPGQLEPLAFTGDAPVGVSFVRFGDRSDPSFPKVFVKIAGRANLEATSASVTFEYLDGTGTQLEDFQHNLTGEFTFEGTAPLAVSGQTSELETTAFFMPEQTASIRVRVDTVQFVNGTAWERE